MCILLAVFLNLFFYGVAEIECFEIDQLSDLKQSMLDYSFEQIEQWKNNYGDVQQEIDVVLDDELIDAIDVLKESSPKVVYFFELNSDMYAGMTFNTRASLFLNHTTLANALIDPLQGAYLDAMNVYGVFSDAEFHRVSYVVLYYAEELPVIVTSFCEVSEGQVVAKTGLVYAYGQYDNEFVAFAGSLLSRFGTESFDIGYYNF